ncbi:hypothetical protein J0383_04500 [Flavobacterium endoglycinae]|uniref:Uncharacterized protein n=1 Tax=Flavobacterium endoglycinae TaxID=2816357 RepID=A0ABX7QHX7_9FLAO|nr:hypothetical protein [Flavobacterium endoglycinae]QSW90083.1 hypothetical protein J0383_04500 [Flavobacterium endoglycinae]
MKFPTTAEDIKDELFKSVDMIDKLGDLRIQQLIEILHKVKDSIIIEGIIQIFENEERTNSIYTDQKYAGLILKKINPKTEENIELLIHRVLKNWNKSVEELPFWLKDNYGFENLKKAFFDIESKGLSQLELENLKTMKWFLRI